MAEIKCPCGLRNHMEEEDCKKISCNACCPLTKPQTNADRIRAMTDDDLAEFMRSMMDCVSCYKTFSFECNGNYDHCLSVCLKWLQQPAETDIIQ